MSIHRGLTLVVTWLASASAHQAGDYLVQRDHEALRKQQRDGDGHRALAWHVTTYGTTQAVTKLAALRLAGVRVPAAAIAVGQLVECGLHAAIDDGRLLERFARQTGKGGFHDVAQHGINGRSLLDQAAHLSLQVPVGAAVTALLSRRRRGGDTQD